MPDQARARRIEALEETIRILQAENDDLAARAEDILLLGLVAEHVAAAETPGDVLANGLERISILKDIPLCTACVLDGDVATIARGFEALSSADPRQGTLRLPPSLTERLQVESIGLHGPECADIVMDVPGVDESVSPHFILLIPVASRAREVNLFVFADYQDDERLASMAVMLHRVVDTMMARIDNLALVAELKSVNDELAATNEALQQATKAKSAFLANMSHEIRTPMNAILGFTQLMRRERELTESQAERLDIINRSGEYLLALINDILEMSKIEAGHAAVAPENFDLYSLLEDVAAVFRERAGAKGLWLSVARLGDVPRALNADPGKLRQILVNLLGNAVKFTERGGIAVQVRTRMRSDGSLRLICDVTDTGAGIGVDEVDGLFTQFEQTRSGRQATGGTGLGLAISREYARMMDGDLTVVSVEGTGSTFTVEIAVEPGDSSALPAEDVVRRVRAITPSFAPPRVLVADDVAEIRELVRQCLANIGFDVRVACDGREALAAVDDWRPDLIVMDIRMPEMDGIEAITRVREMELEPQPRIVVLTAGTLSESGARALASGADDFMSKPFVEADLLERVRQLTGIEYEYEEVPGHKPAEVPAVALDSAMLDALPGELVTDLREATVRADFDRVLALAADAAVYDADLAQGIGTLARSFDGPRLIDLLGDA